jgi:hypothetical protein
LAAAQPPYYGLREVTEPLIGEVLYETLKEVERDSKLYLEEGLHHDNPEFLWIGKGMNYAMEKITTALKDYHKEREFASTSSL